VGVLSWSVSNEAEDEAVVAESKEKEVMELSEGEVEGIRDGLLPNEPLDEGPIEGRPPKTFQPLLVFLFV
jgi:hypothetical protein